MSEFNEKALEKLEKIRASGRTPTFDEAMEAWTEYTRPAVEAIRRSTQLTAEDFEQLGRLRWKL